MKLAKKPIALLLVLLMFLSLLPVGVFAVDDAELTEEAEIVEALPPEEDAEAPAEEEETLPPETGDKEAVPANGGEEPLLPEETDEEVPPEADDGDDFDVMAGPEEEDGARQSLRSKFRQQTRRPA